jgi:hypothetical protein
MANPFTTLCQDSLKKKLKSECPYFEWSREKRLTSIYVDIYGAKVGSVVCIELEMYRRQPDSNATKLWEFFEGSRDIYPFVGRRILVVHIFSPFYEVGPFFKWSNFCEVMMPEKFKSRNVTYMTFRWNLDRFPKVRKACQVASNSQKDFPPQGQLDMAISTLVKDLGRIIREWEAT